MKKFLLTTIAYLLFAVLAFFRLSAPTSARVASAETPASGSYACVLRADTFFYASPDESQGLFLLPPTYYVKLVSYGEEYSRVEYLYDDGQAQKLIGYAKTEHLTFVDYVPQQPYFYHVFELSYRIDGQGATSDFLDEITLTCAYYGDYKIGSRTYCYVLRENTFGYVPKPVDLTVPENTEYAERAAKPDPLPESAAEESEAEGGSSPAQIAILVSLCLLVPVLAALILKPPRRPPYETEE